MQGIIELKISDHLNNKNALFFVIHRDELRAVVLDGHEVSWSTLAGDYEAEFYRDDDRAPDVAALFFYTVIGDQKRGAQGVLTGTGATTTWEDGKDGWLVDGIEIEELLDKPTPPVAA